MLITGKENEGKKKRKYNNMTVFLINPTFNGDMLHMVNKIHHLNL